MRSPLLHLASVVLLTCTQLLAQRNPGYLQYQLNEPRGTQVANTGGAGPAFGTVPTDGWQTQAAQPFGPADPGYGAMGIDDVAPYEHTIATGWPLSVQGSFTISWRQRMVNPPGTALAYAWGSGLNFRCFTGGVAGSSLGFRGSALGDFYTQASVQVAGWQTCFLVVDSSARRMSWYLGRALDSTQPFPAGVPTFSISEGTGFMVGMNSSSVSLYTRFFEIDDFRFYDRALDQLGIDEEIGNENPVGSTFDSGCSGGGPVPSIALAGEPNLAPWSTSQMTIQLRNMPPRTSGILFFGLSAIGIGGAPVLPLDLGQVLQQPGCTLGVLPQIPLAFSTGSGSRDLTSYVGGMPIPSGTHLYVEAVIPGIGTARATPVLDINLQNDA